MEETANEEISADCSVHVGSDGVSEFYCQPCSDTEQTIEAIGFCKDCQEYLCRDCYDTHRKPKPSRNHVLLTTDDMSKHEAQEKGDAKELKPCSKKCSRHQEEVVKYFCKEHDETGCIVCITTRHNGCKQVQYIPDIAAEFPEHEEYMNTKQSAGDIMSRCENVVRTGTHNIALVDYLNTSAKDVLTNLRQDLNEALDRLESEIQTKLESMKRKDATKMQNKIGTSKNILDNVKTKLAEIESMKKAVEYPDLFVAVKEFDVELRTLNETVTTLEDDSAIIDYRFHPNEGLWEMLQTSDVLGNIIQHTDTIKTDGILQASHHRDINIREDSDENEVVITGSVLLDEKLILWDVDNCKLKIIDVQLNKLVTEKMFMNLWDLTRAGDNKIAASVPMERKIVLLKIGEDNTVKEDRAIAVDGQCMGIAYSRAMFVVTFNEPAKIELLDVNGYVLWVLDKGNDREQLFVKPIYVAVNPNLRHIFVSDYKKNSVTQINFQGKVIKTYSSTDLKAPTKPVVDCYGNVFFGGCESNSIYAISGNGSGLNKVLSETNGVYKPQSLSYCPRSKLLYVGMETNDFIKVFRVI